MYVAEFQKALERRMSEISSADNTGWPTIRANTNAIQVIEAHMIPRNLSTVKVAEDFRKWLIKNHDKDSPLLADDEFLFLGEIPGMKGHCAVIGIKSSKLIYGYHTDDFIE